MSSLLRESEVEKAIRKHLIQNGFDVKERKRKQGVDIIANKAGKTYFIEVEGNQKPSGNSLITSQKYTHLLRAIGQICLRMNDNPNGVFVIGLPKDEYYKEKVNKLRTALNKLGVKIYFVDKNKKINEFV